MSNYIVDINFHAVGQNIKFTHTFTILFLFCELLTHFSLSFADLQSMREAPLYNIMASWFNHEEELTKALCIVSHPISQLQPQVRCITCPTHTNYLKTNLSHSFLFYSVLKVARFLPSNYKTKLLSHA